MPIVKPDTQIFDSTTENSDSPEKFDSIKRKQKIRLEKNKSTDRMYNDWKADTEYKSQRKKLIRQLNPVTATEIF